MRAVAVPLAIAATALSQAAVAQADGRVAVPGSDATVAVPGGWVVAPAASDPPSLELWACDPAERDGCRLLAQMRVQALAGRWKPASLDSVYRAAVASADDRGGAAPADRPRRIRVGGHAGVETSSVGEAIYDLADGGARTAREAHRAVTLQVGSGFYRCDASTPAVADAGRLRGPLMDLCSSLQSVEAAMPAGKP